MVAQDTAEVVQRPRKVAVRKWIVRVLVIFSIVWALVNLFIWNGVGQIMDRLNDVLVFVALGLVTEILFIGGVLLIAAGSGLEIFKGTGSHPWQWVKQSLKFRENWKTLLEQAPNNGKVRLGFTLNWVGAAGTGVVAAVGIMVVLPISAWSLLIIPALDIVGTFVLRLVLLKKFNPKPVIRPATLNDVPGLVMLDASRYGEIAESTTDDPETMFVKRIQNSGGLFWVAEFNGEIIGLLSAQQSMYGPDDFTSWNQCTNHGTFEGTAAPNSSVLYVAAMTTQEDLPREWMVFERLFAYGLGASLARGATSAFFSGRMPGFHEWHLANPHATAEQYYSARELHNGKAAALDWQVRYYESLGMKRIRLVKDGFAEDWESEGYSVLFILDFPMAGKPFPKLWGWLFRVASRYPKMLKHL